VLKATAELETTCRIGFLTLGEFSMIAFTSAVEVLRHPERSEAQARGGQDVIERQAKYLTRLIDDLVDVNRITRDELELRKERVDLAGVVRAAVESCRSFMAPDRELTVSLPPEPLHLEADGIRLTQVLSNLLSNAVKYTQPGGHIRLSAERDRGEIVVRVSDDGIGIAPEALPQLFGMFYRVDRSLERTQGGLGVGLALARRLIEMHGGRIDATSAGLGKGCELVVRLPGLLAPSAPPEPESPDPVGTRALARCRILIADDNADALQALALLLKLWGHDVQTALDGAEAVEAARRFKPDVALIDLGMPQVNGYDVARQIREQPWGQRVLLVAATGWAKEDR
jgi:CheY-like chemotaxis protein